jgi:hypothetical protein
MGNWTQIKIMKDGYVIAEIEGGKRLNATPRDHEDLMKGFVHTSGQYQTIASDDYTDEDIETHFNLVVRNSTIKINGVETVVPIAFAWDRFNDYILEGMYRRKDIKLPVSFILETSLRKMIIVEGKTHFCNPFKGGKVVTSGEYGSIVKKGWEYSHIPEQHDVDTILDRDGNLSSSAKEEKRKQLQLAVDRARTALETAQKQLLDAETALGNL